MEQQDCSADKEYTFNRVFTGQPARNGLYRRAARTPTEHAISGNLACISALGLEDGDPDALFLGSDGDGEGSGGGTSTSTSTGILSESVYDIFDIVRKNQAPHDSFYFNDAGVPYHAAGGGGRRGTRQRGGASSTSGVGMSVFVSFVEVDGDGGQ